jgi:hypothetical protein
MQEYTSKRKTKEETKLKKIKISESLHMKTMLL